MPSRPASAISFRRSQIVRSTPGCPGLAWEGERLVEDGACTYGGNWVVNPSGGLLSKGHPIGATGLAQCAELVWQLRGQAQKRQVDNVRAALQHNLGLGGACVVAMYKHA